VIIKNACVNLDYTPSFTSDTLYIGGNPTVPKTYSSTNTLVSSPATTCSLTLTYTVVDKTGADKTTSLSSFITATLASTAPASFTISVLASTDTSIAAGSNYVVTVKAALTDSLTVFKTDALILTIKNSCVSS
jgi:hypothetical protein